MATTITVAAEILRDEVALFHPDQLRYVDGKIEVMVGAWAWRRLREIAVQDSLIENMEKETKGNAA